MKLVFHGLAASSTLKFTEQCCQLCFALVSTCMEGIQEGEFVKGFGKDIIASIPEYK
jgi:hypothetical protein